MNDASLISILMGAVITVLGLPVMLSPERARSFFQGLYRHALTARILTVIDMLWVGALLLGIFWGGFEPYKKFTYVLIPGAIVLICLYVDDLLMPRALGGLCLLVPAPVLAVFRWEPSPFRYVLIILCYVLVIVGFALIMNPYVYRKALQWMGTTAGRFRAIGGLTAAFGASLLGLGLLVFS